MSKVFIYSVSGLLIVAIGVIGVSTIQKSKAPSQHTETVQTSLLATPYENEVAVTHKSSQSLVWQLGDNGWQAASTPPSCPDPFTFKTPADMTKVTGVLYPGQTRGGNYKPHGGLRFDTSQNNAISVAAPSDAYVVKGARFLVSGEIQYTFDFIHPCGIMYRLGHLLVLSPAFQAIADTFPTATEGDSRVTTLEQPVAISAGDIIATSVGVTKGGVNTFFDWGVYDLRANNATSSDATWAAQHQNDKELAYHAVCWFDWLSASDEATIRSLPAGDPTSGKKSDYCK